METPVQPIIVNEGISAYRIIGIVLAFIIFASVMSFSKNLVRIDFTEYYRQFVAYFYPDLPVHTKEDETRSGPQAIYQQEVAPESAEASSNQFWCLVGEDMAGRWCVQVLSAGMCPADRTYGYKNECERFNK